jgi:hypothetical protein
MSMHSVFFTFCQVSTRTHLVVEGSKDLIAIKSTVNAGKNIALVLLIFQKHKGYNICSLRAVINVKAIAVLMGQLPF